MLLRPLKEAGSKRQEWIVKAAQSIRETEQQGGMTYVDAQYFWRKLI